MQNTSGGCFCNFTYKRKFFQYSSDIKSYNGKSGIAASERQNKKTLDSKKLLSVAYTVIYIEKILLTFQSFYSPTILINMIITLSAKILKLLKELVLKIILRYIFIAPEMTLRSFRKLRGLALNKAGIHTTRF